LSGFARRSVGRQSVRNRAAKGSGAPFLSWAADALRPASPLGALTATAQQMSAIGPLMKPSR